ncbi:unnamed protein product [Rotaria magnacalcarata]|uniref:Tudor domain-containing protein n=2 Tax=Rotaria magnacalcarata TaxID=392030 RepID=A0A816VMM9_9BILA|nr:unnamed protein product [Rotaria magnacalcarata]CAF3900153.1 unnamed protein product [Rotaria magnacalcarata]
MVTVIADKEELTTPVNNGVTAGSNDNERPFQYIKDYQEVDFHRSPSCKPLPDDLVELADSQIAKSSINGTFFVQIDSIELIANFNNNHHQSEQINDYSSFLLTITDGITTVKSITTDYIPKLNFNIRPGCKLLLNGEILIKDGLLQLTHDNTRFQYGSNTFPRPRSAYRGRGGGSHRPSYEGRRGGAGNSTSRHDNDDSGSNFLKGPPPKNTLMDFMTSLKISNDTKQTVDNDNLKVKDRHENKRRNTEHHYQTNKHNDSINTTNLLTMNNSNYHQQLNDNNYTDQITFQQEGNHDQLDPDDDSSHSNYRERRNPLPPRLQRAQEERTRRNTNRYYDDLASSNGSEINGNYLNGAINNSSLSSSSSYSRRGDPTSYMTHNSSVGHPHTTPLNTYASHMNMLAPGLGSTSTHLTYFSPNMGPLTYNLAGIPSSSFHSQQPPMVPGYTNDPLGFCYRGPYINPAYIPSTVTNGLNEDSKMYNNSFDLQKNSLVDEHEHETKTENESQQDQDENKYQVSSIEQKTTSSASSITSSSSNDVNDNSQQVLVEQQEDNRRDSNLSARVRWRIGDTCLARWSEDQEFYVATIIQIQPHFCIVLFHDYNNYDKLHFSELKILPRDQQYYQFAPPITAPPPDMNVLGANVCFSPRTNYYSPIMDECIMMPEAPPFPFNSSGTLYMCPPTFTSMSHSTRYNNNVNNNNNNDLSSYQQTNRRIENGNINDINYTNVNTTINSSSSPSKDSNDTSIIDSTTTSIDDNQNLQQQDILLSTKGIRKCSIADAPIKLVTHDDERDRSSSTESVTSSKYNEQQSRSEEEKQENNSVLNVN